jgi:hypothetical protein
LGSNDAPTPNTRNQTNKLNWGATIGLLEQAARIVFEVFCSEDRTPAPSGSDTSNLANLAIFVNDGRPEAAADEQVREPTIGAFE